MVIWCYVLHWLYHGGDLVLCVMCCIGWMTVMIWCYVSHWLDDGGDLVLCVALAG